MPIPAATDVLFIVEIFMIFLCLKIFSLLLITTPIRIRFHPIPGDAEELLLNVPTVERASQHHRIP